MLVVSGFAAVTFPANRQHVDTAPSPGTSSAVKDTSASLDGLNHSRSNRAHFAANAVEAPSETQASTCVNPTSVYDKPWRTM